MSSAAAPRAAIASLHRGRPYVSLRGRSEFARVYRNGKRYRRGRVVMVTTVGAPGPPQVAFVAGRRVGNAVVRNRAKRRLREATARVKLCEDTAYVVVAQRGLNDAPFDDLVEWVGGAADRGSAARSAGEQPMAAMEDET